jgi:hypothetical protein
MSMISIEVESNGPVDPSVNITLDLERGLFQQALEGVAPKGTIDRFRRPPYELKFVATAGHGNVSITRVDVTYCTGPSGVSTTTDESG